MNGSTIAIADCVIEQRWLFALRHTATGQWMPSKMHRTSSKGWSHWDPGFTEAFDPNPRLFWTHGAAVRARTAWAAGAWERAPTAAWTSRAHNPEPTTPPHPRKADDLEIVPMTLAWHE